MNKIETPEELVFLATSADLKTWDSTTDMIVLAESGCAVNVQGMEEKEIYDPNSCWNNSNNIEKEVAFLNTIQDDIMKRLVKAYCVFCGQELREIDVDRLLYPWLDYYIEALYYKFLSVEIIQNQYHNMTYCKLLEKDFYCCNVPMDFMAKVAIDDYYNMQLYTYVGEHKGLLASKEVQKENVSYTGGAERTTENLNREILKVFLRKCKNYLQKVRKRMWGKVINYISHNAETVIINPTRFLMTKFELFCLILQSRGKIGAYYFDIEEEKEYLYDVQSRERFEISKENSLCEFETFLLERLVYDLPMNCIEGVYDSLNDKNSLKYKNVKKVVSVSDAKCESRAKAFIISQREKCTWYQIEIGGGGDIWYGRTEVEGEKRLSDVYYTNGWGESENRKILRPYYNPRFLKAFQETSNSSEKRRGILYVGTFLPKYRCAWEVTVCWDTRRYVDNCVRFLETMYNKKMNISVRLNHDCGWNIENKIREKCPSLAIESLDIPFQKSVRTYELYVCDWLSTTWGEAYATGTPIIIIGNKNLENYSKIGKEWIERLRKSGIYQENYQKAAKYIEGIYDNIETWWYDSERQLIMKEFAKVYASLPVSKNKNMWVREIRKIANE